MRRLVTRRDQADLRSEQRQVVRVTETAAHHAFRKANRRRRKSEGRDDAVPARNLQRWARSTAA